MLNINETRRTEVTVNGNPYTLVRDWLDQYDLYDGDKHLGTFQFSQGTKRKRGHIDAFRNSFGVNMFWVQNAGSKAINDYASDIQSACERIVKESENAGSPTA